MGSLSMVVVTCNGQHLKYLHAEYVLLLSDTIGLVRILMVAAKPYKLKHVPFLFLVPNEDDSSSTVPLYHCKKFVITCHCHLLHSLFTIAILLQYSVTLILLHALALFATRNASIWAHDMCL